MTFIHDYCGVIVALIAGTVYAATHRKVAVMYAEKIALAFMLKAEKRAEELILADGPAKLAWVVDSGYELLPSAVRLVVSKPLFKTLAQTVYDDIVAHLPQKPQ